MNKCKNCGVEFNPKRGSKGIFCSRKCSGSAAGSNCKGHKYNLGKVHSKEHNSKIREWMLKNNPFPKGSTHTEESKQKMSNATKGNKAWNKGIPNPKIRGDNNPAKRTDVREKIRIAVAKYIRQNNGVSYNPDACKLFEEINKEMGWSGIHAENGGEKEILGYFVDYYEPNLNLVIEYDEKHHKEPKRQKSDSIRQKRIQSYLKCKFIRIPEEKKVLWREILNEQ